MGNGIFQSGTQRWFKNYDHTDRDAKNFWLQWRLPTEALGKHVIVLTDNGELWEARVIGAGYNRGQIKGILYFLKDDAELTYFIDLRELEILLPEFFEGRDSEKPYAQFRVEVFGDGKSEEIPLEGFRNANYTFRQYTNRRAGYDQWDKVVLYVNTLRGWEVAWRYDIAKLRN